MSLSFGRCRSGDSNLREAHDIMMWSDAVYDDVDWASESTGGVPRAETGAQGTLRMRDKHMSR